MRKKLITKTYLRDVDKYILKIWFDNDEFFVASKKIKFMENPFVISSGECLMDNNYSIIEVIPKNENYAMRVYFDENNNILQYYFDVSLKNGVDEETKVPFYDDLFVDITVTDGKIEVLDEDELDDALNSKIISKADYDLAIQTRDKLLSELQNGTNEYFNMNLKRFLLWSI